ncbi:MAG: fibronectin type III domain-containing protein [Eubacterium sp.]|nr:fibronectin type III domain-containing protein [Eubacterium sp.]
MKKRIENTDRLGYCKKLLSIMLAFVMLFSITSAVPITAEAATYKKISALKVPRIYQQAYSTFGGGDCNFDSVASVQAYVLSLQNKSYTYDGTTRSYSYGKDYKATNSSNNKFEDPICKKMYSLSGGTVDPTSILGKLPIVAMSKVSCKGNTTDTYEKIYNQLKNGKPVVVHATGKNAKGESITHAGVVIAYTKDSSTLSAANFTIMEITQGGNCWKNSVDNFNKYANSPQTGQYPSSCYRTLQSWLNDSGKRTINQIYYPTTMPNTSATCTIAYNANGGTGSMGTSTVKYNSKLTLESNKFSKTGYIFSGWNVCRKSDNKWFTTGGNGWQTASNINSKGYTKKTYDNCWSGTLDSSWFSSTIKNDTYTFYAIWEPCKLDIRYNVNGGSINSNTYYSAYNYVYKVSTNEEFRQTWTHNQTKKDGLYNAKTFGLYRDGYTFVGWGTTPNGDIVFDQDDTNLRPTDIDPYLGTTGFNRSKILYAIWEPIHNTHNYNYIVIKTNPTCTDGGYTTYKCSCGDSYVSNYTSATGHSYDSGKVTKAATCTANGVKTYTCTKCKAAKTETIKATGHNAITDKAVAATCTTDGKTVGSHCSVCNKVITAQGTIPATGHNYETIITKSTTQTNGSIIKKCTICGATTKATIYYPKTVTLSTTNYTYNGKAKKPSVTVKDSKGKKIATSNYTVTYQSGRKNVGKYTVTIKFKGNYSGTVKKTFTIKPKATTLSSVTAKSKGFTAKWKKLTTQTTGYQIQYSTSSKFSSAKTVTVSKNSTTSKTVSKLTAKKKYYVRIRTYKTVGKTKIYSAWSKSKSVTTKK